MLRYFRKFLSQSPHDARKLKVIKLAFKQNIVGRNQICRSCVTMRVFIKSVATYVHAVTKRLPPLPQTKPVKNINLYYGANQSLFQYNFSGTKHFEVA